MKGYLVVRHFNQLLPFPGSVNNLLLGVFCNQNERYDYQDHQHKELSSWGLISIDEI